MLMRFRFHPVAVVADIKAMFSQVKVQKSDKDLLRFLWFPGGNLDAKPKAYCMTRHVFGATSSPFAAAHALQQAANESTDPTVRRVIKDDFYVDDLLTSCATEDEAKRLCQSLMPTLEKSGFHLTKFLSNKQVVLDAIPYDRLAPSVKDVDVTYNSSIERTLGLRWVVASDEYTFKVQVGDKPNTRRGILSTTSSLYDPLGFVAPVTLLPKILLHN